MSFPYHENNIFLDAIVQNRVSFPDDVPIISV